MTPNAKTNYNPDPDYLRELIAKTGLTQNEIAGLVGISTRTMRRYITFKDSENYKQAPYAVQFAIECLAND